MADRKTTQPRPRDDRHPDWWAGIEAMAIREDQERREREHEQWLAQMRARSLLP